MTAEFLFSLAVCSVVSLAAATGLATGLARAGFPLPPGSKRIGCIDGLRGFLALSVMVHHFYIWVEVSRLGGEWRAPSIHFLEQLGSGAVGLFFMTTGMVFYPKVLSGIQKTSWSSVYLSRFFRIVPLVGASLAAITAIIALRTGLFPGLEDIKTATQWVAGYSKHPFMGYPDSNLINAKVLWTLGIEWVFYLLILPFSAAAMDVARRLRLPTWSVPAAMIMGGVILRFLPNLPGKLSMGFEILPLFGVGMLAYEIQARASVQSFLARAWVAVLAVVGLIFGMLVAPNPYGAALPLFAFFFTVIACGNSIGGLLNLRGILVLGECSFGIYLLHGIVLNILVVDLARYHSILSLTEFPVLLAPAMLMVVIASAAAHLAIERPSIRFGRSIGNRLRNASPNRHHRSLVARQAPGE